MAATSAVAQRMYQDAASQGGNGGDGAGAGGPSDEEVVDAEIVDEGA
jgi:hypothetical protein